MIEICKTCKEAIDPNTGIMIRTSDNTKPNGPDDTWDHYHHSCLYPDMPMKWTPNALRSFILKVMRGG